MQNQGGHFYANRFENLNGLIYTKKQNMIEHKKRNQTEHSLNKLIKPINEIDFYTYQSVQPPNSGNRYK